LVMDHHLSPFFGFLVAAFILERMTGHRQVDPGQYSTDCRLTDRSAKTQLGDIRNQWLSSFHVRYDLVVYFFQWCSGHIHIVYRSGGFCQQWDIPVRLDQQEIKITM